MNTIIPVVNFCYISINLFHHLATSGRGEQHVDLSYLNLITWHAIRAEWVLEMLCTNVEVEVCRQVPPLRSRQGDGETVLLHHPCLPACTEWAPPILSEDCEQTAPCLRVKMTEQLISTDLALSAHKRSLHNLRFTYFCRDAVFQTCCIRDQNPMGVNFVIQTQSRLCGYPWGASAVEYLGKAI